MLLIIAFSLLIVGLYGFRQYLIKSFGSLDPNDEEDVNGKIVLITGANGGIGKATSLAMAKRGGIVLMACRQLSSAKAAIEEIRRETDNGELIPLQLDLASFESIREFCSEVKGHFAQIDILINNAGVMIWKEERMKTQEGFEINMGTNHLGHFLLTNSLLRLIKASKYARIVTVSSISHKQAVLDLNDLNSEKFIQRGESELFGENQLYANSKLANLLFSFHLAKLLQREKSHVKTYACCPGIVHTDISRHMMTSIPSVIKIFKNPVYSYLFKTCAQGSETIMFCALSKNLANDSGKFYRHCKEWSNKDFHLIDDLFVRGKRKELSSIDAGTLWDLSLRLAKL